MVREKGSLTVRGFRYVVAFVILLIAQKSIKYPYYLRHPRNTNIWSRGETHKYEVTWKVSESVVSVEGSYESVSCLVEEERERIGWPGLKTLSVILL
jgi:hypothetical protein